MNKKIKCAIVSISLSLVIIMSGLLVNVLKAESTTTDLAVRTVELQTQSVSYESILNEFKDGKLETTGSLTTFEGVKTLNLSSLTELNNLSEASVISDQTTEVKYNFSYDSVTNLVTLSATSVSENGEIEVEEITGIAFQNEKGEVDALLEVDGEFILLSEMQDLGLIQNCGWFKSLVKKLATKIVIAVVAVVVVSAVVAAVVATCGAGLGAVITAGAIAGGLTGAVSGGLISYSEYGKLDWRWIVGGAVIGAALGAVTGWGVGTIMGAGATQTTQVNNLIKIAKDGKLDFSNSIKNQNYFQKGSAGYRSYYEQANTISQEIMKAKNPIVESSTNCLKWTVEGSSQFSTMKGVTNGVWELVIDPVTKVIVHFLFRI